MLVFIVDVNSINILYGIYEAQGLGHNKKIKKNFKNLGSYKKKE